SRGYVLEKVHVYIMNHIPLLAVAGASHAPSSRSSSSTGPATTSTSTSTEEAPSPTETSEGKSGGMSSENTIALGVGIPAAMAGLFSAVLDVWLVKRRRRMRALQAVPAVPLVSAAPAVISSGDSSSS
ncbi:hypothetical protein FOC1_g10005230, partial [Fusarium oxysporum f. sp. cubense race 1]